jgi:uncharacterized protein
MPVEKRICLDETLSKKDESLSKLYIEALEVSIKDGRNADLNTLLKTSQRIWLHLRDRCPDTECLNFAYDTRVAEINSFLKTPVASLLASKPKDRIVFPSPSMSLRGMFPPYPVVSGVELPKPVTAVYETSNGDFLIVYSSAGVNQHPSCSHSHRWHGRTFFVAEKFCLTDSQVNYLANRYRRINLSFGRKHLFMNGSSIETINPGYSGCYSNFSQVLLLKDKTGRVVAKKVILMLYENPRKIEFHQKPSCGTDVNYAQSVAPVLLGRIHVLPNDSVLIVHEKYIFLVDKNIRTVASFSGVRLFTVDWQKVMDIESAVIRSANSENYFQTYDDAMRVYLLSQNRE